VNSSLVKHKYDASNNTFISNAFISNDYFWFGLIFIKKISKLVFLKKTETGLNRLVLVRFSLA
jgi:hypothetical protein